MSLGYHATPSTIFSALWCLLFCMPAAAFYLTALTKHRNVQKSGLLTFKTLVTRKSPTLSNKELKMTHSTIGAEPEEVQIALEKIDLTDTTRDQTKNNTSASTTLVNNAKYVAKRVNEAAAKSGREQNAVRLVCVSKTKPAEDIQTLYDAGFRIFGENYFQELLLKAEALPKDIQWHFIGNLQSTKASKLVRTVLNLSVVETVDTLKLAKKLDSACEGAGRPPLSIYIQVDTSGEDTKSGIDPADAVAFVQSIREECPLLVVAGLMTIGAPDDFTCFDKLVLVRDQVAAALSVEPSTLALSMGMSGDYEEAIERGSSNVRVGSTIFGARDYGASK